MRIPRCLVGSKLSQLLVHFPILGERPYIHSSTHTARRTEHILMTDSTPQSTVAAHTQSTDGTRLSIGNGSIVPVCILHQFRGDKSLITVGRILRTVPIPTVLAVRTYKYDSFLIRHLRQFRLQLHPAPRIAAITVQQINHRTSLLADSLIRQYIHNFYILIHGCTSHQHRVYTCRLQHYGRQTPQKPQGNNSFFHLFIVYFF